VVERSTSVVEESFQFVGDEIAAAEVGIVVVGYYQCPAFDAEVGKIPYSYGVVETMPIQVVAPVRSAAVATVDYVPVNTKTNRRSTN